MRVVLNFFLFFFLIGVQIPGTAQKPKDRVNIIFDSDMGPDYDDVGAIAVLHALAAKGECEILATIASDRYPYIAPTLEVFNRYFAKPNIPVGAAHGDAPDFSAPNHWNDSIVLKFLPQIKTHNDYPSAVELYRKVLAAQKDQSVVIVSVGFLSNLAALLKSLPDTYSPLGGKELVAKKVKKWVAMAGGFPEGSEFNINRHASASAYAIQHWPTPILFSGFEIGTKIMTILIFLLFLYMLYQEKQPGWKKLMSQYEIVRIFSLIVFMVSGSWTFWAFAYGLIYFNPLS